MSAWRGRSRRWAPPSACRVRSMLLDLRFGARSAVAAVAAVAALAVVGQAAAGTVTVRNDGDAAAAGEELLNAVNAANAGDVIVLSPGDYNPAAPLDVTKDLTIVGPERAPGARITAGALAKRSAISDGFDLVAVDNGATATIRDVALTGTGPSGIALDVFGGLVLEDSVVGGNNGLAVAAQPEASVTIRNTTISDNSTGLSAAAGAKVSAQSVTIAGNRRGGIFNASGGVVDLASTIVWGNGSPAAHAGDCQRRLGGDAPGSAANSIDGDGTCGANIQADPRLGRLEDNGGPTATRSLASGSPAINAGSGCTGSDQRGASRVGACDIGAFEYGGSAPPGASPPPANGSGGGAGPGSGSGSGQGGSTPPGSGGSGSGGSASGKPPTGGDKSAGAL